jgi:ADP-ribose pyrophosphatase
MQADGKWERRSSRYLFESRWYRVRQDEVALPSGEAIDYTLVEHPGYTMVVPVLDDGRVILERVFRYALQETLLECPSGGLDGQAPDQAALRELEEETGWVAGTITQLGAFYGSAGISDERYCVFLAQQLTETGRMAREATEQMVVELMPLEQAFELAIRGEVVSGPSALAIIMAHAHLEVRAT